MESTHNITAKEPRTSDIAASNLLAWEDVLPTAQEAFSVWMHGRELEWAQVAWGHIAAAGLTTYRSELERCRVAMRLLALAQLYLDWCSRADEQSEEDDLSSWAWELDIGTFRLGQLMSDYPGMKGDDDDDLRGAALRRLAAKERGNVHNALLTGFEGENRLFLSLWRINHPAPVPRPPEPEKPAEPQKLLFTDRMFPDETPSLFSSDESEDETDEEEDEEYTDESEEEDDWEVMNNLSEDKMAAYEWIADGCPSIR